MKPLFPWVDLIIASHYFGVNKRSENAKNPQFTSVFAEVTAKKKNAAARRTPRRTPDEANRPAKTAAADQPTKQTLY